MHTSPISLNRDNEDPGDVTNLETGFNTIIIISIIYLYHCVESFNTDNLLEGRTRQAQK